MLAHRTAQHWGLDTLTAGQGPEQGRIVAMRTERSGPPATRLSNLKVKIEEISSVQNYSQNPSGAPKVLTRHKTSNDHHGHRGSHHRKGGSKYAAIGVNPESSYMGFEEREQDYERARARIFGNNGNDPSIGNMMRSPLSPSSMGPYETTFTHASYGSRSGNIQRHSNSSRNARNYPTADGGFGGSQPNEKASSSSNDKADISEDDTSSDKSINNKHARANRESGPRPGYSHSNRSKAQLRNRQEDLSDPDFRRNRGNNPNFGWAEDMYGRYEYSTGMYLRPTYATEFPHLGGTPYIATSTPGSASIAGNHPAVPIHPGHPSPRTVMVPAYSSGGGYPGVGTVNMPSVHPQMSGGSSAMSAGMPGTPAAYVASVPGGMPIYFDSTSAAAAAAVHHHKQAAAAAAAAAAAGYIHPAGTGYGHGVVSSSPYGNHIYGQPYYQGVGHMSETAAGAARGAFLRNPNPVPLHTGGRNRHGNLPSRNARSFNGQDERLSSETGSDSSYKTEKKNQKDKGLGNKNIRGEQEYDSNIDEKAAGAAAAAAAIAMQGVGQFAKESGINVANKTNENDTSNPNKQENN